LPISSCLAYVQGLLDGTPMPGGLDPMASYVIPPDPNVQTEIPTVYVWPAQFEEDRDPKKGGRSMPRNTGPGTFSGVKVITHNLDLYFVWMAANDDGALFPAVIDAAMYALRTAYPMPAQVTDPYNPELVTQINDVGETMSGGIFIRALEDEAWNRFDCQLRLPVVEEISA
jgi:hypothetical protein